MPGSDVMGKDADVTRGGMLRNEVDRLNVDRRDNGELEILPFQSSLCNSWRCPSWRSPAEDANLADARRLPQLPGGLVVKPVS